MPLLHPDEPLPSTQVSLEQFLDILKQELDDQNIKKFLKGAMAGRHFANGDERRIFVNPLQDKPEITHNPPNYTVTRDYDSAIGVTRDLPFSRPLAIFPLTPFKETLKKTNHVTGLAFDSNNEVVKVPLFKIPNVALGKVQQRHITRIFFPRLYSANNDNPSIPTGLLADLYDKCILPTVQEVIRDHIGHWPANYDSAFRQAQDDRGQLHFSSIDVPPDRLALFADTLLAYLNGFEQFKEAYFLHELRGTKGGTMHDPSDQDDRESKLQGLMEFLDIPNIKVQDWWVDVALEVHMDGYTLQWNRDAHRDLIMLALPSIDATRAAKLVNSRKLFHLDKASQFSDLAGFRNTPNSAGKTDQVLYITAYTTDKSATYQLFNGGSFRRRLPTELFPAKIHSMITGMDKMSATFAACAAGEWGNEGDVQSPLEGNARLEIRVKLASSATVLCEISEPLLSAAIVPIKAHVWWQFKFYRLCAFIYIIKNLAEGAPRVRMKPLSLTLGLITIYMMNALNFRPAQDILEQLVAICGQHGISDDNSDSDSVVEIDEDGDTITHSIAEERGLYFIADIDLQKSNWTMAPLRNRALTLDQLAMCYRSHDYASLSILLGVTRVLHERPADTEGSVAVTRVHNRRRLTLAVENIQIVEDADDEIEFGLAESGVRIRGEEEIIGDEEIPAHASGNPDERIKSIWRQFPQDIVAVAPNPKSRSASSYLILPAVEIAGTTWELFNRLELSHVFSEAKIKTASPLEWNGILFDRFFPPKGTSSRERGTLQNFPSMRYYNMWFELMDSLSDRDAMKVRKAVSTQFRQILWLPGASSDRCWITKQKAPAGYKAYPPGHKGPSPHVIINAARYEQGRRSIWDEMDAAE